MERADKVSRRREDILPIDRPGWGWVIVCGKYPSIKSKQPISCGPAE